VRGAKGSKPKTSVNTTPHRRRPRAFVALVVLAGQSLLADAAPAQGLTPDRVLLLYNSANAESQAVRDLYIAAHPNVREFDLDDPDLGTGSIPRADYLARVRAPLLSHLETVAEGVPLAERIIAIATTRGLPARIDGENEFAVTSTFASLESELVLLQQDLEAAGEGSIPTRHASLIDNPYHVQIGDPITSFDRSAVTQPRPFELVGDAVWRITGLTPGDMYLVCRLDAAPGETTTALDNIAAMIERSADLRLDPVATQALLDEYSAEFNQLDDDGFDPVFPTDDDFDGAAAALTSLGVAVLHDESFDFIEGQELPNPLTPLLALGTYGENHDFDGLGANPPGRGTYIDTYESIHPAGVFISYESFNGSSLVTGSGRGGQAQAADFIAAGGSFTIAHVAEPFTLAVADLTPFVANIYGEGLTFAEAAYSAIPALSWQSTPLGDPLARVAIGPEPPAADLDGDGDVDGADLGLLLLAWEGSGAADLNGNGIVDGADLGLLLLAWTP